MVDDLARRIELQAEVDGDDITRELNKYLISCAYTDNEEDKADDLTITLDDRDSEWIGGWLPEKGSTIHCTAIQRNQNSDGVSRILDCGTFEIDTVDASGGSSGATVSIKGTSLPYTSSMRTQTATKAWENVSLSAIASECAGKHGMSALYESDYNPQYERREQVQESDIVFLQGLCKDAGISLKATDNMLVLFDEEKYEQLPEVYEIKYGKSDVLTYQLSAGTGDVNYGKCHVSYTEPQTGKTIEYTYTPRDNDKSNDGQILEVNEKVADREEARKLAMKRLRQKNKGEFSADFTLVGDVRLVAGVTVLINGYGVFDGKYIIETAAHNFTGGYTVGLKLRRCLEGY